MFKFYKINFLSLEVIGIYYILMNVGFCFHPPILVGGKELFYRTHLFFMTCRFSV